MFRYNDEVIDIVKKFNYLGIVFSKGGSFVEAMKNNVKKAMVAIYDILKKGRMFNLSIKCQYDLFDKIAKLWNAFAVLLCGTCIIWGGDFNISCGKINILCGYINM